MNIAIQGAENFVPVAALIVIVLARLFQQSLFHPVVIFAALWGAFYLIKITSVGLYPADLLATSILFVLAGSALLLPLGPRRGPAEVVALSSSRAARIIVFLSAPVGIGTALLTQQLSGVSAGLSLDSLLGNAQAVSVARYSTGSSSAAVVVSIAFAVVYMGAMLAPAVAESIDGSKRILALGSPFIGAAAYALLTTARASFLIVGCLFVSAWIAKEVLKRGASTALSPAAIFGGAAVVLGVFGLFVGASFLRYGGITPTTIAVTSQRIQTYLVGSAPALDQWANNARLEAFNLGTETFAGFVGVFADNKGDSRAYDGFVSISAHSSTNVFTMLRSFFDDFGWLGGVIALFLVLAVASLVFKKLADSRSVRGFVLYSVLLSSILFSPYLSLFSFTNFTFAFVVLLIFGPRLIGVVRYSGLNLESADPFAGGANIYHIKSEVPKK